MKIILITVSIILVSSLSFASVEVDSATFDFLRGEQSLEDTTVPTESQPEQEPEDVQFERNQNDPDKQDDKG